MCMRLKFHDWMHPGIRDRDIRRATPAEKRRALWRSGKVPASQAAKRENSGEGQGNSRLIVDEYEEQGPRR